MDQKQFNAIKERVAKATPGPWESGQIDGKRSFCVIDKDSFVAKNMTRKDSEFVAHAREDVPALVAEVERLHELRKDDFLVLCEARDEVRFMQKEVVRLREALQFYAVGSNYLIEWSDKCDEYMPSVADNDGGEIARQALGGEAHE